LEVLGNDVVQPFSIIQLHRGQLNKKQAKRDRRQLHDMINDIKDVQL